MTMETTLVAPKERTPAWQRTGTAVTGRTAAEAIKAGGLDWKVEKLPVFTRVGKKQDELELKGKFATVRMDTHEALGFVGINYQLFQNLEAFAFFDNLVDSGEAKYETALSYRGGKVVALAAKVPKGIKIAGVDPVGLFLILATSHDGSRAIQVAVTPIRFGCENTLNIALKSAHQSWTVRHTSTMQGRLLEAREALELTFTYVDEFQVEADRLFAKAMTERQFKQLTDKLNISEHAQGELLDVFVNSPTMKDIRGTQWAALNAVGEYYEWGVSRTDESRVKSTLNGRAQVMRNRAYALLS